VVDHVAEELNQGIAEFPRFGYVVIPEFLSRDEADVLSQAFEELPAGTTAGDGRRFLNERDVIQHEGFVQLLVRPALVDVLRELVGDDFQLLSYDCAETSGGAASRRWHLEFPVFTDKTLTVLAAVYLTDLTPETGPLYIVPGSHLWQREPRSDEAEAEIEGEVAVTLPAGAAVVFHGALWHSTSPNVSTTPRRALFPYFGPFWMKRLDQFFRRPLPAHVVDSPDPLVRQLFGLEPAVEPVWGAGYADTPRWQ
jgi:ectoine hydroxylase-related dioxygenase (phytanoyl-CoA dioxygenase family)